MIGKKTVNKIVREGIFIVDALSVLL